MIGLSRSRWRELLAAWTVAILGVGHAWAGQTDSPAFVDPAPPVAEAPTHDAPVALPNQEVHLFAAPKPLAAGAATEDWPCFLGPRHNGIGVENHLLQTLPAGGPSIVWQMNKGEGYAQPVVSERKLVLFHRLGNDEVVDCLEAKTGNRFWRTTYPTAYEDRFGYCNGPRGTPAISGDFLVALGAEGKLHCLQLTNGHVLWKRDLLSEFHLKQNFFGVGTSPLILGDKIIINVGANGGPTVAAFDLRTGKMLWGAGRDWGPSYASPVPAVLHGKQRVLIFAGGESRPPTGGLLCIDPTDGHVDFTFPWRGTRRESVNASSPVVVGDQVFISECYGSGGVLLDVSADLVPKVVWTNPNFGTHFMTAIPRDGHLYGVDGHGPEDAFFCCVDFATGMEKWRNQPQWDDTLPTADGGVRKIPLGTFRCQLLLLDGRCLCMGEFGHLLWLDLNPRGYKQLCRAWLIAASETWTPPVVSRGLLYVCQNTASSLGEPPRLICHDFREK